MANAFTTSTARFKPFSFQEMLQPYAIYTDAYNKVEEELANLDIMAGDVAGKLSNTEDAELATKAATFKSDLTSAMENLYNKGLNPNTRKQLAELKARYSQEMNPINEAYKLYQEDQKYLSKMALEHPEILIEGAGKSVSDYMNGKAPQMRSVNTDDLMNEALNLAKTQAGRTYRESSWTSTAGGRFLEKTVETGLNDVDFNNALAFVRNPNLTAEDFGMNESQFNAVKNNAVLLGTSINEIVNSPNYAGLSTENKQKALNSVMKGIRAGFQYDKKTSTESDPMFAYNLKKREELDKAKAKRAAQAESIGSDYFLTPDETKADYRNIFTQTLGKNKGALNSFYEDFFKDGKLISSEEVKNLHKAKSDSHINSFHGYGIGFIPNNEGNTNTARYEQLVDAFIGLGLDPSTATKEDFLNALNTDVKGRRRASITSDNSGFNIIESNIKAGLRNTPMIQEITGLKKGEDGMSRYKTKGFDIKDLYDKDGNIKLDILRVNMDYHTGERSFIAQTPKGIKEFIIPDGAAYKAEDPRTLNDITSAIREVEQGYETGYQRTKDGKTIEVRIPLTPQQQAEKLQELYLNANLIFGDILNYFGADNMN